MKQFITVVKPRALSFTSYVTLMVNFMCQLDWAMQRQDISIQFSSIQSFSRLWLFATPWTAAHQASLSIPTPGVCSNSCLSSQWWYPTISSSVVPFSLCLQSFPASGSFPMSQFFHQVVKIFDQTLFWVLPWGCIWMTLTFESSD